MVVSVPHLRRTVRGVNIVGAQRAQIFVCKKRAKVALGHDILIAAWHIMRDGVNYADLGADYFDTHAMDLGR